MVEARLYLEGSGARKVSHALTYLLDQYPPRLKGKGTIANAKQLRLQ